MTYNPARLSAEAVGILEMIAHGYSYEPILSQYPELTYIDIFRAAQEALDTTAPIPRSSGEGFAEIRKTYPRAYEKWTGEEETTLAQLVRSGKPVEEIANQLQRQPGAIQGRMAKKGLLSSWPEQEPAKQESAAQLEAEFHQAMLDLYDLGAEHGYYPTSFRKMVLDRGGAETARVLLAKRDAQTGLAKLWQLELLPHSAEALVLQERFRPLFTDAERQEARRRLEELGYPAADEKEVKDQGKAHRDEVLVAIMNSEVDLAILQDQGWYRIPVATAPSRWPPRWLAFLQTGVFGEDGHAVNYYGAVRDIRIVGRHDLFPEERPNAKSDRRYYQIRLDSLEELGEPIPSSPRRRIVFIPTTWEKFNHAVEINDLFDQSPLEDRLWAEFRKLEIPAERQWAVNLGESWYFLDFALFCADGRVDVETDGDTWHADPRRIPADNRRDNDLAATGWHVLRFNGKQIREEMADYCVPKIAQMIDRLDGLVGGSQVPPLHPSAPEDLDQPIGLHETEAEYNIETDW